MLSELVLTYRTHLEAEGRSLETGEWHGYSLAKFGAWLSSEGLSDDPESWTAGTIRSYFVALKHSTGKNGQPLSPHSIRSYGSSLRSFLKWLYAEEFIPKDVTAKVKQPATPKLVKPTLSPDECRNVLQAAKAGGRNGIRDEALILFLLDTGARVSELCSLTLADIQWEQRLAKLYGKGAKERYVPFSAATMKAIQRYRVKARGENSDRLFQSEDGQPLTRFGVYQLCERIGANAGVHLNPHKLRHTFAISYLRAGASVFALQKTLGHATLDVTLRYAALVTDDLINDHAKHSPVAALMGGKGRR